MIDLRITEECASREQYDKIIRDITGLKNDIRELFENDNERNRKETV